MPWTTVHIGTEHFLKPSGCCLLPPLYYIGTVYFAGGPSETVDIVKSIFSAVPVFHTTLETLPAWSVEAHLGALRDHMTIEVDGSDTCIA